MHLPDDGAWLMLKWLTLVSLLTAPVLAQSVGSSSGISAVSASATVSVPTPAAQAGLTTLTFHDNSFSSIDRNNTLTPGFKWYANNAFPNAFTNGTLYAPINTAPPTPSADIVVSNGVLTLTDDVSHVAEGLNTCVWTGSALIGTTFTGPLYIEVGMAYDPTLSTPGAITWSAWPIYWFTSAPFLAGTNNTSLPFAELDGFECDPNPTTSGQCLYNMAVHQWNTSTRFLNQNNNASVQSSITGTLTNQNRYGTLYVPASANNGLGLIRRYYNSVLIPGSTTTFAAGVPSPTGATPSNPNGNFTSLDRDPMCLMIGAGHNWPASFANIQLWTGTYAWNPAGSTLNAPTASTVTDGFGNTFGFGIVDPNSASDYEVLKNGTWYAMGGGVKLVIFQGAATVLDAGGQWFIDNGSGFTEVRP